MNPFNPESGDTPAPVSPDEIAAVEHSARVMWRAFPYFAWRYGDRGRAFGRSDAGYLATFTDLDEAFARRQVEWLTRLLAARGMPGVLLEYQLESLGRSCLARGNRGKTLLLGLAESMRARRVGVLPLHVFAECERLCRAAAGGFTRRRGAGLLIASAVADRAVGVGDYDEALTAWFCAAEPQDVGWSNACVAAHKIARAKCQSERSTAS